MRLLVLALALSTALASETSTPSPKETLTSGSTVSPPSSSPSASPSVDPTANDPTPVGALWTAAWTDSDLSSYTKKCASTSTFSTAIYTLGQIYPDLKTWAPELKVFYHKQLYPGSWSGVDKHGNDRELMKMPFEDLPFSVREWLTRNPKQRHFSVQDDVVFFAPGAIYPLLPLWVDEAEGALGECEGLFEDLENYSNELKEGAVVGRMSHTKKGDNEVEVTIEAFQVTKAERERDEL